jgi:hypothetical protein
MLGSRIALPPSVNSTMRLLRVNNDEPTCSSRRWICWESPGSSGPAEQHPPRARGAQRFRLSAASCRSSASRSTRARARS